MAAIQRVRLAWDNFPGGPGVSTFYSVDAVAQISSLLTLFEGIKDTIPAGVALTYPETGDVIDDATGDITGSWAGSPSVVKVMTGAGTYSAPSGYQIKWPTAGIVGGHRVHGRTFIVPCVTGVYDSNGTMVDAVRVAQQVFVTAFYGSEATNTKVWSRPRVATPSWTDVHGKVHAAKAARAGSSWFITSGSVQDKIVVLRSRRD